MKDEIIEKQRKLIEELDHYYLSKTIPTLDELGKVEELKGELAELEQEGGDNIITIEQRTTEILNKCSVYSVHPSRENDWQIRTAIIFLAKEIDTLHKIRIITNKLER